MRHTGLPGKLDGGMVINGGCGKIVVEREDVIYVVDETVLDEYKALQEFVFLELHVQFDDD